MRYRASGRSISERTDPLSKSFRERLRAASQLSQSLVCVGLDPDPARMPVRDIFEFNRAIIDATKDLVCAYKPNLAFYEAQGLDGLEALMKTVDYIKGVSSTTLVIGDAKRGDIAPVSEFYARALFDVWGFDAVTVNCYGGGESIEPFISREGRGVFVWCRSSNPGAGEFQDLTLTTDGDGAALHQWVARRATEWNGSDNIGLVLGATFPGEIGAVRRLCPKTPLLIPGVGAQGGDLAETVRSATDSGGRGFLIASSRSIIYASEDRSRFADASRRATAELRDRINKVLGEEEKGW